MHDWVGFLLLVYIVLNTGRIANKLDPPSSSSGFGWSFFTVPPKPRKPPKPPGELTLWWRRHGWWLTATAGFTLWFLLARGECTRFGCG